MLIISSWFSLKTPYKLRNLWQVFKPEKKTGNLPIRLKLESKEVHLYSTFSRLTDARNWAQKTESDIREGLYFKKHESRKHTLKELIKRYTEEILPHKPKVIYDYKTNLKWFEKKIGH